MIAAEIGQDCPISNLVHLQCTKVGNIEHLLTWFCFGWNCNQLAVVTICQKHLRHCISSLGHSWTPITQLNSLLFQCLQFINISKWESPTDLDIIWSYNVPPSSKTHENYDPPSPKMHEKWDNMKICNPGKKGNASTQLS